MGVRSRQTGSQRGRAGLREVSPQNHVFMWQTLTEHLLYALGMFCVSELMPTSRTPQAKAN